MYLQLQHSQFRFIVLDAPHVQTMRMCQYVRYPMLQKRLYLLPFTILLGNKVPQEVPGRNGTGVVFDFDNHLKIHIYLYHVISFLQFGEEILSFFQKKQKTGLCTTKYKYKPLALAGADSQELSLFPLHMFMPATRPPELMNQKSKLEILPMLGSSRNLRKSSVMWRFSTLIFPRDCPNIYLLSRLAAKVG